MPFCNISALSVASKCHQVEFEDLYAKSFFWMTVRAILEYTESKRVYGYICFDLRAFGEGDK